MKLRRSSPASSWTTPPLGLTGIPLTRWRARRPPVSATTALFRRTARPAPTVPSTTTAQKMGKRGAKACKESVLLFLLRPGNVLPLLVRVPVTSKGLFLKYAARLTSTLTPINGVVTRITLQKATSRGGKPYALFHFEAVSALGPEEAAQAKAFARQLMEAVKASEAAPKLEAAG